jgi:hypothetical protein
LANPPAHREYRATDTLTSALVRERSARKNELRLDELVVAQNPSVAVEYQKLKAARFDVPAGAGPSSRRRDVRVKRRAEHQIALGELLHDDVCVGRKNDRGVELR